MAWMIACLLSSASGAEYNLPENLITIEEDAFAGTPALREVRIPGTLETNFAEAFPEADETIWVHCAPGSMAESFLSNGLDVDAQTAYRALLIGETYPYENNSFLEGPANDVPAMQQMLSRLDRVTYQITARRNISAEGILSAILSTFGEATEYDISLFYYSGHGLEIEGQNYLTRVDTSFVDSTSAKHTSIPLTEVIDRMRSKSLKIKILILDLSKTF